jgi:hypothetical protein
MYRRRPVAREGKMSEERFDRIEGQLGRLETGQTQLREDFGQQMHALRDDLGAEMLALRGEVSQQISALGEDLGQQMHVLRGDVGQQVRAVRDDLGQQMRVLHEDLVDRIKALPERSGPTQVEFGEQKEHTEIRLSTLELAVRQHSTDIEQLKPPR